MSDKPQNIENWLSKSFVNIETIEGYWDCLRRFAQSVYGMDCIAVWDNSIASTPDPEERRQKIELRKIETEEIIDRYLKDERVFLDDIRRFIIWMVKNEYAPGTINITTSKTRKFFKRMNKEKYTIDDEDWDDIKSGLLPENVPSTRDEILTKPEMRRVFSFLPLNGKAIFSLAKDTGARIGALLAVKLTDVNLDVDPPEIYLRKTKKGLSPRKVWFTHETVEAIKSWLVLKDTRMKKRGGYFDRDMLFGFTYGNARLIWNTALRKAKLDKRDPSTKKRFRVYRIHTLRKFFRTEMGEAGMVDMIVHGLMGHKKYLAQAYDRPRELARTYQKFQHAVELYPMSDEERFKDQLEELDLLREQMKDAGSIDVILGMINEKLFKIPPDMKPLEKWLFVYGKMRDKWLEH